MFEFIIGNLFSVHPTYIVLESNNIGYQIHVANPYNYQDKAGQTIKIYIEQVVREDSNTLYGFSTLEEKQLFLHLNTVKNIGPRIAMSILAVEDHTGLVNAIHQKDITYLMKFPGIGKRTAQQMLLDLEGKIDYISIDDTEHKNNVANTFTDNTIHEEAVEALLGLGYSKREVNKVKKSFESESFESTQEALSFAFKLLIK